ncbi:MAG TPA: NIPSNAP family protein [Bacteroidales bacterium]|nr:NIPSNAP family protein [Bacteroidales bacterium]HPF03209.1 NIPSNAP family protein [Bacteroidales bacterium]HPJ59681.1 NIPSNAP family protein [Bacteroidales bacterium]HPR12503.1 NIPSNAP family protein [Bacteroidales bacterium]HRW84902.1 NIPSNAP family protein [Bacteroidales bacterium]
MKKTLFLALILFPLSLFLSCDNTATTSEQMYYEIRIYGISQPSQAEAIDNYLANAFIPAMHRAGISKVGVFKPVEADTVAFGKLIYVFIPYNKAEDYFRITGLLENDAVYLEAGKAFLDAPVKTPPFDRYESIFMKAFSHMPAFKTFTYSTPPSERIYELRSYESATEAKALKKIHMFNEGGEIAIFEKVGSNAVFYGQVLFGSLKPRLMYMTTYADMKSHDEHWNAFRNHPDWLELKARLEYASTTSKTAAFLCHPTDYSDF